MKSVKHLLFGMAVIAMSTLGVTSCSNELTPDEPMRQGEVDVVMTTSLPQSITTYATDGTDLVSSAEGGLKNLAGKGYKIRFIMEVYPAGADAAATPIKRQIKYNDLDGTADCRKTSFQTRLLAAQYDFVFWADIVKDGAGLDNDGDAMNGLNHEYYGNRFFLTNKENSETEDVHFLCRPLRQGNGSAGYINGDLKTIIPSQNAINQFAHDTPEMYDGYAAHETIDLRIDPPTDEIVLKRPFAKLRLLATDINLLKDKNPAWNNTIVTFEGDNLPNAYNALTENSFSEEGNLNKFWRTYAQAKNSGVYADDPVETADDVSNGKTLYVFYLPVGNEAQNLKFNITVKDKSNKVIVETKDLSVSPVPLYGNKLTTIKGNLLSKNPTFNIRIDDEFEPEETVIENKEVSTIEDLKSALTGKDQTFTFTSKVTKAEGFELDFTNITRSALELNKATIILNFASIEEGAVITVKGGANSPKVLRLNTNAKCSVRMDFPATTTVTLNGQSFKYLVYNCYVSYTIKPSIDALLAVDNEIAMWYYPTNRNEVHRVSLDTSFNLVSDANCGNAKKHDGGTCNFISTIQTWLNSNSGSTVWDFVGDTNN